MTSPLRIAFAGTPEFAAHILQSILDAQFPISLVLTQPDRPAGRGMKLSASAVKRLALAHQLPLSQPEKLKTEQQQLALQSCQPDVLVVVAYGLLLPPSVLSLPRYGCINVHASLLPRWRGAAPIQRAILSNDKQTGISIMQMAQGLDTGPVLSQQSTDIYPTDTTQSLHDRLANLGAQSIISILQQLSNGIIPKAQEQSTDGVCYAHKISKAEALLDWSLSAEQLHLKIRAFSPFPGAYCYYQGQLFKIWQASIGDDYPDVVAGTIIAIKDQGITVACGKYSLIIHELQRSGSRRMSVEELMRGSPLLVGEQFSTQAT